MSVDWAGMPAQIGQCLVERTQHCSFKTAEQESTDFFDAGEVTARLTVVGKEDDHRQSVHVRSTSRMQGNGQEDLGIIDAKVAPGDQLPDRRMEDHWSGRLSHVESQGVI